MCVFGCEAVEDGHQKNVFSLIEQTTRTPLGCEANQGQVASKGKLGKKVDLTKS